jgi:hypothetical protein
VNGATRDHASKLMDRFINWRLPWLGQGFNADTHCGIPAVNWLMAESYLLIHQNRAPNLFAVSLRQACIFSNSARFSGV